MLALFRPETTGTPSRYHEMMGTGVPTARHCNDAILLNGRVWFMGTRRITGGGCSSEDITLNLTRIETDPA